VVIYTSQTMQDIPYGDYFSVEVRWDIEDLKGRGADCCNLRISLDVPFTKKTVWKGEIWVSSRSQTVSHCGFILTLTASESWRFSDVLSIPPAMSESDRDDAGEKCSKCGRDDS
jgi:hypothetical protein